MDDMELALKQVFDWGRVQSQGMDAGTDKPGRLYSDSGGTKILDLESYGLNPYRSRGNRDFADAASFCEYLERYKNESTFLTGSYSTYDTTAILNPNTKETPDWEDFEATLKLVKDPEWIAWTAHDGKQFSQVEFADFIEDHANEVDESDDGISPARLIEVALNLRETTESVFESKLNISNGMYQMAFREDIQEQERNTIKVPTQFVINLRPFRGSAAVIMLVRLRYRITSEKKAIFFYKLDRPDRILDEALNVIWKSVETLSSLTVLRTP